jgi:hypothetical protein
MGARIKWSVLTEFHIKWTLGWTWSEQEFCSQQYTYVLTTYSTTSALFCLISVGYHSELRVAKTFTNIIVRHQLRYVTLFNVHTNYTKYDI